MTTLRISAEDVAALGDRLGEIAEHLESEAAASGSGDDGFIGPSAQGAVDGLHGDFELERVDLCERLRGLADLARSAGACYLDTEDMVTRSVTPEYEHGRKVGLR